ncbi:MAG: hypothetical protein FWD57_09150 [Polyangiaceae bacterium]|nr:hypothetical protein [Polyangiaceae bacterium]
MNRLPAMRPRIGVCLAATMAATGILGSCSCGSDAASGADRGDVLDSGPGDAIVPDQQPVSDAKEAGKDVGSEGSDPVCDKEDHISLPGWKLNREWSCACRMFDPQPGTELPDWGRWEKCPSIGPKNVDCRVIVPPLGSQLGTIGASVDVDPNGGHARLALIYASPTREEAQRRAVMVFDADGPTRNAMIIDRSNKGGCQVHLGDMHQGKVAVRVTGKDPLAPLDFGLQAVMGGNFDGPLGKLVYQWDQPPDAWTLSAFVSSDLLVVATPTFERAAADWSTMQMKSVWEKDPEGLQVDGTVVFGNNVFVGVSGAGLGGIMSWNPGDGLRPLFRNLGDRLERASNFGTDGKDMVWTLGRRKEPQYKTALYDEHYLMTAPFTTDPAVVASNARVVRAEHDGFFVPYAAYRVGCGHAAHITFKSDLVVVRLSDGAQWIVERFPPPDRDSWAFDSVLGLTCDEVFLGLGSNEGYYPGTSTVSIARIRIDSLGEPSFPPP